MMGPPRNADNGAKPLQEFLQKADWKKRAVAVKPGKLGDSEPMPPDRPVSDDGPKPLAAKNRGGRPRVLDGALKAKIVSYVEMGLSIRHAAAMIGCSHSTISREVERDSEFRDEMELAEQRSEVRPLISVLQACDRSWRAAAWLMKHHKPHQRLRREKDKEFAEDFNAFCDTFFQNGTGKKG